MRIPSALLLSVCFPLLTACERETAITEPPSPPAVATAPSQAAPAAAAIKSEPTLAVAATPAAAAEPIAPGSIMMLGTSFHYAQTFTVREDGFLTAIELPINHSDNKGCFLVDFYRVPAIHALPDPDARAVGELNIPGKLVGSNPVGFNQSPKMLSFDIRRLRIEVKKGDILMFTTRFGDDGKFGLLSVTNDTYLSGQKFDKHIWRDHPKWTSDAKHDLVFRILSAPAIPDSEPTDEIISGPGLAASSDTVVAEVVYVPPAPVKLPVASSADAPSVTGGISRRR